MNEENCGVSTQSFEIEDIPFSKIPSHSRIFLEYQQNPIALKKFYPSAVSSHTEIQQNAESVLQNYEVDRDLLCEALRDINERFGANEKVLSNISLLNHEDCVAVVTGQQAGLLTGPLYSIYKALTAIKLSECLRMRGIKAVPIFWIATEDHDFAEVSSAFVMNNKGRLTQLKNEPEGCYEGLPVGLVKLDESVKQTIEILFNELPRTDFTDELRDLIQACWIQGISYGEAFGRMMNRLFGNYGLILLCPMNRTLKQLASPIYAKAVEKSDEIVKSLLLRNQELFTRGFHNQVAIAENYFPIFWQSEDGKRHSLKKIEENKYQTKDSEQIFTKSDILDLIKSEPFRFSPSVVLRPVVQDYLLPTVCYFGGAAEIAYFAQAERIYSVLHRPVTTILHRQSFTFVTSKQRRILKKYDLEFQNLFTGLDEILSRVIEKHISPDVSRLFAEAEEEINLQLNRLDQEFSKIDPSLAENLAKRRRKIMYHISALRRKYHYVQAQKHQIITRRLEHLFDSLLPLKHLQERTLNVCTFLNSYGLSFIDMVYSIIDLENRDHRVIYLD